MKRVIVVSPYRGNWLRRLGHRAYARHAVRDSLLRGEAPLAGHLLYPQRGILREHIPAERGMGIEACAAWIELADEVAVYADYGVSEGMQNDIGVARSCQIPVVFRHIISEAPDDEAHGLFRAFKRGL